MIHREAVGEHQCRAVAAGVLVVDRSGGDLDSAQLDRSHAAHLTRELNDCSRTIIQAY